MHFLLTEHSRKETFVKIVNVTKFSRLIMLLCICFIRKMLKFTLKWKMYLLSFLGVVKLNPVDIETKCKQTLQ
jgi:hypothetical protein